MKTRIATVSLVLLVLVLVALLGLFHGRGREMTGQRTGGGRRGAIVDRNGVVLAEDRRKSEVRSQKLEPEGQNGQADPGKSEVKRAYPLGETVACVVGFVGLGEGRRGVAGLELGMDSILQPGRKGGREGGRQSGGLRLTIDADVQRDFFKALQRYVGATRAAHGSAVMTAGATGEILALAEYPGPDPARARIYPPEVWESRAVTEAFPVEAAVRWPANENWRQTAEALRFGRAVGIGLPDETAGMLSESAATTRVSLLQLVRAFSILAEDGRLNRPHLLANQPARRKAPAEQVISNAEAREMLTQLAAAPRPDPGDTMRNRVPKDVRAATESAQVFIGVFSREGQKCVVGAMLDQPLPGYYTAESARQLVADLDSLINHR